MALSAYLSELPPQRAAFAVCDLAFEREACVSRSWAALFASSAFAKAISSDRQSERLPNLYAFGHSPSRIRL
jgi:hypothetical protein